MGDEQQAPERVWITWDDAYPWDFEQPGATAYVRADLVPVAEKSATPSDVDELLFALAAKTCEHLAAGMRDCSDELPLADWCVVCKSRGLLQKYERAASLQPPSQTSGDDEESGVKGGEASDATMFGLWKHRSDS